MAAVSQSIPTLLGGVSQQPDPIKLPGQVREADNVLLDPTFGCVKRPATYLVAEMATNIPVESKWFPIFRDQQERYIGCVYRDNGATNIRVFEADSGIERTVDVLGDAGDYIDVAPEDLEFLTIADYTLVLNKKSLVTMSSKKAEDAVQEALVVVNQVGYKTTYQVDFLRDGSSASQVKVYRAAEIKVSPGSYTIADGTGNCTYAGTADFLENSGSKTNLGFNLRVTCNPVQRTTYVKGDTFPTGLSLTKTSAKNFHFWFKQGSGNNSGWGGLVGGSYVYYDASITTKYGNINFRVEGRLSDEREKQKGWSNDNIRIVKLSSISVTSYTINSKNKWKTGLVLKSTLGTRVAYFKVSAVDKGPDTPQYSFDSTYSASVTLSNGGSGWRKGDSVTVALNGKNYKVTVTREVVGYSYQSESSVSYTTPNDATQGPLDVGLITGSLTTQINNLSNYTAQAVGNVVYIKRTDARTFNIQARGGSTDSAMYGIKGTVNDISRLPSQGVDGMVLKVRNSQDSEADDYYVEFRSNQGDIPGAGSWIETVKPGIQTEFNTSTLPHALIRQSDGDFEFRELSADYDEVNSFAARDVGDEKTNPDPTFVGKTINGMCFHMNRLGFLSGDGVIMSQPGDYFNFWVGSAIAVSDADPIDMSASSVRPATLHDAVSTAKGLLLFSTDAQFLMSANDVAFGPSTVKLTEIANYSNITEVKAMTVGTSVFFNSDSTTFSKVFEIAADSVDQRVLIAENTRTIPEYIPTGLTWAAASANNNIVIYGDDTSDAYVFKFWNQGNERSLAGWCRWRFSSDVRHMSFYDDVAYMVTYNSERTSYVLSKMNMLDDPSTATITMDDRRFEPRLDSYAPKADYDAASLVSTVGDNTRFRLLPGQYDGQEQACIQFNQAGSTFYKFIDIETDANGAYIELNSRTFDGSYSYNIGMLYDMRIELPQFFIKQEKRVDRVNVPMVTNVNLELYLSGNYSVTVQRLGYDDIEQLIEAKRADVYKANASSLINTETSQVGVYCRGDLTTVTLSSNDPLPAGVTGYTWEGHYNNRGVTNLR